MRTPALPATRGPIFQQSFNNMLRRSMILVRSMDVIWGPQTCRQCTGQQLPVHRATASGGIGCLNAQHGSHSESLASAQLREDLLTQIDYCAQLGVSLSSYQTLQLANHPEAVSLQPAHMSHSSSAVSQGHHDHTTETLMPASQACCGDHVDLRLLRAVHMLAVQGGQSAGTMTKSLMSMHGRFGRDA